MTGSRLTIATAISFLLLGVRLVEAGGPGKGGPIKASPVRASVAPKGPSVKAAHAPTPTRATGAGHHGGSVKTTTSGKSSAHTPKTTTTKATTRHTTTTDSTTAPKPPRTDLTSTTTSGPTLNPTVERNLQRNNALTLRLQSKLGADADLTTAASGFRNWGQFVAATNNSKNADQFWQLRANMTGFNKDGTSTGAPTMSLGQAKQALALTDGTSTPTSTVTPTSTGATPTSSTTSSTTSSSTGSASKGNKNRTR
jgi:hypothetical protein